MHLSCTGQAGASALTDTYGRKLGAQPPDQCPLRAVPLSRRRQQDVLLHSARQLFPGKCTTGRVLGGSDRPGRPVRARLAAESADYQLPEGQASSPETQLGDNVRSHPTPEDPSNAVGHGGSPAPHGPRSLSRLLKSRASSRQPETHSLRPRRIILVRHGESEGNVDETAYTRIADSRIALTQRGWEQAKECGQGIRRVIEADGDDSWKMYFYVSPYRRTIQTLRGIGLAFERERIAGVREEARIREQDFGNFQCRERMQVEKQIRMRFGRFFYRFPDGESAADVYDRITGFRETLRADIEVGRFQRPDFSCSDMNLVLVSHGLTLRVFLMRWFKWTVEQFEGLYNFGNATPLIMERGQGGRYSLRLHHSREELREFGMTDHMIDDQEWQIEARPGDLNHEWITSGPSFFDHFDEVHGIRPDYVCDDLADGCVPEREAGHV